MPQIFSGDQPINVELKTNVSETVSSSIIAVNMKNDQFHRYLYISHSRSCLALLARCSATGWGQTERSPSHFMLGALFLNLKHGPLSDHYSLSVVLPGHPEFTPI
jgi:hypothetical protein